MGLITVPGTLLTASPVEAYVAPVDLTTNRLNFVFTNNDTALRQVKVWIVPAGQSVDDQYLVIGMETNGTKLRSGETRTYSLNQALGAGDKIFWQADSAAQVSAKLDISEIPVAGITVDGFTRAYVFNDDGAGGANTIYMPNVTSLAYEVEDVSPARQAVQQELLVHNIDTERQAFTIKAVPQGEDSGDNDWIISSHTQQWHLWPGETRVLQGEHFLTTGYGIYWRALNPSVIVARLTVEEVRF